MLSAPTNDKFRKDRIEVHFRELTPSGISFRLKSDKMDENEFLFPEILSVDEMSYKTSHRRIIMRILPDNVGIRSSLDLSS